MFNCALGANHWNMPLWLTHCLLVYNYGSCVLSNEIKRRFNSYWKRPKWFHISVSNCAQIFQNKPQRSRYKHFHSNVSTIKWSERLSTFYSFYPQFHSSELLLDDSYWLVGVYFILAPEEFQEKQSWYVKEMYGRANSYFRLHVFCDVSGFCRIHSRC